MQRVFPASLVFTYSSHRKSKRFLSAATISCSISCRFLWVIPFYWILLLSLSLSLCFSICSCFHMRLELIACSLRNRFNLSPRVDFMPHIRIHINEAPSARRGSVEDRSGASWLVAWLGSAWLDWLLGASSRRWFIRFNPTFLFLWLPFS